MKSLIFFAIVIISFACTNVEKYYFVYSDGEWVQVEEDPRPDNELEKKDSEDVTENSDNENIAVSDKEENDDISDFDDVDEENSEEILPEQDIVIPEDVCIYINNADITGKCYEAQDGEKIFISTKKEPQRCKATVESTVNPNRYFYGIQLPFYTEDNSSDLDYNSSTQKVFIDAKEFTESSC